MVHLIVKDISALRQKVFADASQKEKLFYLYATKGDTKSVHMTDSNLDKLSTEAFVLGLKESETLKQLQRSKPIKNMHYSKNLIDLIAAAVIDFEGEHEHIESYLNEHGLREAYIFHLVLGTDFQSRIKVRSDIEALIEQISVKKCFDFSVPLFEKAIYEVNHIFDLLILERLYAEYLLIHPEAKSIDEYKQLRATSKKISKTLDGIIMLVLTSLVAMGAVVYLRWFIDNKDVHDNITGYLTTIFSTILLIGVFLGLNFPEQGKFLHWMRYKTLSFIYKILGLEYSSVQNILNSDDE